MSFKDDFFEALRSVKNDFLGDPGGVAAGDSARSAPFPESPSFSTAGAPGNVDSSTLSIQQFVSGKPSGAEAEADADRVEEPIENRMDAEFDADDNRFRDDSDEGLHTAFDGFEQTAPFQTKYGYEPPNASLDSRKIFDFSARDGIYEDDKTIISRNTVIRGQLQTEDSIRLLGQVMGDIDCKSNIVVAGKVSGNTSAANAFLIDAQVDGNLLCDDAVNVSSDTWILGNIRAQQAEVDGKIKGNIEIRHNISIGSTSSIIGNISTDELEIKRGAFINGQIIMYSPAKDVLDRFDTFE